MEGSSQGQGIWKVTKRIERAGKIGHSRILIRIWKTGDAFVYGNLWY